MPTLAEQSCEYDDLLDALATVCEFGSGLDASKIVEWFADDRPPVEGQQVIAIWPKSWLPDEFAGAGREGMTTYVLIQITLWTVGMVGKAATDKYRFRNPDTGHLGRMNGLFDYLDGINLFDDYNSTTKQPTANANALNWEPLQHVEGPIVEKVDKDDESWIKTPLRFRTRIVKPLDTDIVQ